MVTLKFSQTYILKNYIIKNNYYLKKYLSYNYFHLMKMSYISTYIFYNLNFFYQSTFLFFKLTCLMLTNIIRYPKLISSTTILPNFLHKLL